jgi:uncharacterized membrane protein YfcA
MIEIDTAFLLASAILLVAAVVSGLAGFGFSIVSVPPLLLLYDPGTAIAVNKILTIGTTWLIVAEAWRHISWRWVARLLPTALAGLFVGGWLLKALDPAVIKVIAGAVVFALAALLLTWRPHRLRERGWIAPAVGLVSGVSSTATGMAGPPLVLTFTVLGMAKEIFRATAAAYFVLTDLVGLPALVGQGAVTTDDLRLALALAPVAVIGRLIGMWLVRYVSPLAFRRATLGLLLLTGTVSIVTGLAGL